MDRSLTFRRPSWRARLLGVTLLLLLSGSTGSAVAAVVVLANRTERPVRFTLQPPQGKAVEHTLESGGLLSVSVLGETTAVLPGNANRRYQLQPNTPYFFRDGTDGPLLEEIGITGRPRPPAKSDIRPTGKLTIPVKLLVDDDEPASRRAWEERLRKRLQTASDIIERHCRVRFEVVAFDTWESDNQITDFHQSAREFEKKTSPDKARLAIGFTSQYQEPRLSTHLGLTRNVLGAHILIREWWPRSEQERLEVLVHELGHFLGSSHSPEPISVMRPRLADGKAIAREFRIGFDPLNTLVMCQVAEEVQTRGIQRVQELSAPARDLVGAIYGEIARALPHDVGANELARWFAKGPPVAQAEINVSDSLHEGTRHVIGAIVQAAERNQRLPPRSDAGAGKPYRLSGDALTEVYVREAAAAARQLPDKLGVSALLLGLGIALDSADFLRKHPATRGFCARMETDEERKRRLDVVGLPTLRGRHDLLQHFVVSGALTAIVGPTLAETAGLMKEQMDMQPGGSGFSFADLCADLAGIAFAGPLRQQGKVPARLADAFTVADYIPEMTGLREGLSQEAFSRAFGSISDERFQQELAAVRKRVQTLPGYEKKE